MEGERKRKWWWQTRAPAAAPPRCSIELCTITTPWPATSTVMRPLDVFDNEVVVLSYTKYVSTYEIGHMDANNSRFLDHSGLRFP